MKNLNYLENGQMEVKKPIFSLTTPSFAPDFERAGCFAKHVIGYQSYKN
jgi:hypothetical protein